MSLKSLSVQYVFAFILSFQASLFGFTTVWPSYTLKVLERPDSPLGLSISKYESNLVGSIPMIGSLIATSMAGYVCDRLGRKRTQIVARLLVVLAWCLNLTAKSAIQLLIGRFLDGLGCGLACVAVFVYTVEITQLSARANATAIVALMYNVGILLSYVLGWFCSYEVICYFAVTSSVFYTVILCCMKETPVYLLRNGHEKEALASLKFFRGERKSTEEILEEFSYIKSLGENIIESKAVEKSNDPEKEMLKVENGFVDQTKEENPWKLLWTVDHNRRALFFYITYMVLSVSMGMIAVQAYAKQFMTQAVPSLSPDLCSVLQSVVFICACCVMVVITNMLPRRLLMISSGIIATICLAVFGTLLKWSWGPSWLPLLIVIIYIVVYQIGIVNIPLVQLSESFGPDVNSTASAILLCSMFITNFVVLSLFLPAVKYLGMADTFFIFTGISLANTVICIFFQKETRHVPLEKVQRMYAQGYLYKKI